MYPEEELGKKFWDTIYKKAEEQFGTKDIPVNTFNKVWILPENATVYEHEQTVYVTNSRLKVMLDSDYEAMKNANVETHRHASENENSLEPSKQIIREIILPEIEREVNEGKHFAPLRQIYHSLILAKWYKETIKDSLLSEIYVDQNKIDGVKAEEKNIKEKVYAQYMEAYKKGVFDYIKEDYDQLRQEMIPRKYFSGGLLLDEGGPIKISSSLVNGNGLEGLGYKSTVINRPQSEGASSPIGIEDVLIPSLAAIISIIGFWGMKKMSKKDENIFNKVEKISKNFARGDSFEDYILDLIDDEWRIRAEAVQKLQELGDERAFTPLVNILGNENDSTVIPVIFSALSTLGGKKAIIPIARKMLVQKDTMINLFGLKALNNISKMYHVDIKVREDSRTVKIDDEVIDPFDISSSPISLDELLNIPSSLIGALEEKGQMLSVKAREVFDISLWDYGSRITEFVSNYPWSVSAATLGVAGGGLYYYWSRYTKGGHLYMLDSGYYGDRKSAAEALDLIENKLDPKHHHLISGLHIREVLKIGKNFSVTYNPSKYERRIVGYKDGVEIGMEVDWHPVYEQEKIWDTVMIEPESLEIIASFKSGVSSPILDSDNDLGGIDMNRISINHRGAGVDIQFDLIDVQTMIDMGITGLAPVIINFVPLPSILPLLGLEPKREEDFELSQVN